MAHGRSGQIPTLQENCLKNAMEAEATTKHSSASLQDRIHNENIPMCKPIRIALALVGALICAAASAASMNGKLPLYPRGHNMNSDMPASVMTMGVPMVLETTDAVHLVDLWFTSNAPKSCARSEASGGVKYACPGGSIMIYAHGRKTQVAYVPAMAMMGH